MDEFFCKDRVISRWSRRVWGVVLFLGFASLGMAQLDTGTISGTVTDPSGAAVPGATVTIRNVETGVARNLLTNAVGRYDATALPVGMYEVRTSLTGFQTLVRSGITLTVGRNAVVDMSLQVGEVAQAITVAGEASFVETTTATVANLVDEKRVADIPLNNRDLTQLAFLQPGVLRVPGGGGNPNSSARYGLGDKLTVAGARASQNIYLTDGVSNSNISGNAQGAAGNYSGAETIKEFQIITNNYSAEYASKAGAIVSAVTKSGTNAFHGSLFEFHRNDNLDAFKWEDKFTPDVEPEKPEFKRNQLGGSLGGPIMRDRAFFFTSYEALRERQGRTQSYIVPSVGARAGNFGAVSSVTAPYLALFPVPGQDGTTLVEDFGDGRARVSGLSGRPVNNDFGTGKLDYQFASARKGFLAVTYSIDDAVSRDVSFVPADAEAFGIETRKHVISARHTSILSPTALNEFTFGYTRSNILAAISQAAARVDFSNVNGVDLRFRRDIPVMGRLIPGDDIMEVGGRAQPNSYGFNSLAFRENMTLTRQRHTFKFGAELQHVSHPMQVEGDSAIGNYEFDGLDLFLAGRPNLFETGLPDGLPLRGGLTSIAVPEFHFSQYQVGFYFQDNFALLPSLTLNLGLRYEFQTVPTERDGHSGSMRSFFDDKLTIGPAFANPTKKNFSPRVGFAWAPGGKTSLRGGVGIYYEPPKLIDFTRNLTTQTPFNAEAEANSSSNDLPFPDLFTNHLSLLTSTAAPTMRYVEYDQSPTTIYRWSLTLEREQGPWMVSAGYTGSRAVHLWMDFEANYFKWDGWPNEIPAGEKVYRESNGLINPAFSRITNAAPAGNSYYHGLTVNVLRRLSAGLQIQTAYSYSKAIDQGSGMGDAERFPQDQGSSYYWDKEMMRGLASFDIRNNFVTNLTYDFPQTSLTGVAGALANGWQMSGILSLADGVAFRLDDEANRAQRAGPGQRGTGGLRPNLIPGGDNNPVLGGPDLYYDPTQFTSSTCFGGRDFEAGCRPGAPDYRVGSYGNLGNNTLTGPGLATVNFSLNKTFGLTETKRLQFRSEFFNLFNRPNFALPNFAPFLSNGRRDPDAGRITSTNTSARQIQFALKFIF
jgi:hypothetical protein